MNDLTGIGEAVSGSVVARSVEPEASGVGADGHTTERACLNCRTPLAGHFCHACGQRSHVHRTLGAFLHDLAHGVLHLDGKIWRTLPLLVWRPGELTRRYVDGERARFVSPMALFLFSVFMMFAAFSTLGPPMTFGTPGVGTVVDRQEAEAEWRKSQAAKRADIRRLEQERAALLAAGQPTATIDGQLAERRREQALEERVFRDTMAFLGDDARPSWASAAEEEPRTPGPARQVVEGAEQGNAVVVAGATSLNDWFNDTYRKAKQNPSLLFYKLQTNAYKFSWLLIPLSVPFMSLMFLHRRRYRRAFGAYDHTVFVTYSIAFMSLGVIVLSLLRALGVSGGWLLLLVFLVPPVHMYRQLKGAYGLSRWSAGWRTLALLVVVATTATLFGTLLLLLGVLG